MSHQRPVSLGVALLVAAFATGSVVSASTVSAGGKIRATDFVKRKISVVFSDGSRATLAVPASVRIKRNGGFALMKGLVLGDEVSVSYQSKNKVVSSLTARGPKVVQASGAFKGLNKATGVIKVGLKSYRTNAYTRVARNGRVIPLGGLTRKDTLVVHSQAGTGVARDIQSCGPEEDDFEGILAAIDLEAKTITITPSNGTPDVTLSVDAGTMIEVNCRPATLADLQLGMKVEAEFNPNTLVAFFIEARLNYEEGRVKGTVTGVDLALGAITIQPDFAGAPITLAVTASTEIEVNGAGAALADVQVGMPVKAKYDPLTLVATRIKAGTEDCDHDDDKEEPDIKGTISVVAADSITVVPFRDGDPLTLLIDASTKIELDENDGPATILDLAVGTVVEVEYDALTMTAKEIEIKTGEDEDED
jgi:hypothetical protein